MSTAATTQRMDEHDVGKPGMISLLQIIQNLILLGLNSITLWQNVIPKLKNMDNFSSQPELLDLQLILSHVSHHLFTNVFNFFPNDLSQDKLPLMCDSGISSKELLKESSLFEKEKLYQQIFFIRSK